MNLFVLIFTLFFSFISQASYNQEKYCKEPNKPILFQSYCEKDLDKLQASITDENINQFFKYKLNTILNFTIGEIEEYNVKEEDLQFGIKVLEILLNSKSLNVNRIYFNVHQTKIPIWLFKKYFNHPNFDPAKATKGPSSRSIPLFQELLYSDLYGKTKEIFLEFMKHPQINVNLLDAYGDSFIAYIPNWRSLQIWVIEMLIEKGLDLSLHNENLQKRLLFHIWDNIKRNINNRNSTLKDYKKFTRLLLKANLGKGLEELFADRVLKYGLGTNCKDDDYDSIFYLLDTFKPFNFMWNESRSDNRHPFLAYVEDNQSFIYKECIDQVTKFLETIEIETDIYDSKGVPLLFHSVLNDSHLPHVIKRIQGDSSPQTTKDGTPLLHWIVGNNFDDNEIDFLDSYLEEYMEVLEVNPLALDSNGNTALIMALNNYPETSYDNDNTMLRYDIQTVIRLLSENEKVVNYKNQNGRTALDFLVSREKSISRSVIRDFIYSDHINYSTINSNNQTPLMLAFNNPVMHPFIYRMIDHCGSSCINHQDNNGQTILMHLLKNHEQAMKIASYYERFESNDGRIRRVNVTFNTFFKEFLDMDGVDLTLRDNNGNTLLDIAIKNNLTEEAKLIKERI